MAYDYSKLSGRIVEKFKNRKNFATAMGITQAALSSRMTGKVPFRQMEIVKAKGLLDIEDREIGDYFFDLKVQND